jgi:hypothetical protein
MTNAEKISHWQGRLIADMPIEDLRALAEELGGRHLKLLSRMTEPPVLIPDWTTDVVEWRQNQPSRWELLAAAFVGGLASAAVSAWLL